MLLSDTLGLPGLERRVALATGANHAIGAAVTRITRSKRKETHP
jgi:hypothetical protein